MDVVRVQAGTSTRGMDASGVSPGQGAGKTAGNGEMTGIAKSDFLKLLVAQLRNQDPMKPMEDKEFIAQMAQLNTVEQLTAMNTRLNEFLASEALFQAGSLLGKTVVAEPSGSEAVTGVVQGVRLEQSGPLLIVAGKEVPLTDVKKIVPAT